MNEDAGSMPREAQQRPDAWAGTFLAKLQRLMRSLNHLGYSTDTWIQEDSHFDMSMILDFDWECDNSLLTHVYWDEMKLHNTLASLLQGCRAKVQPDSQSSTNHGSAYAKAAGKRQTLWLEA